VSARDPTHTSAHVHVLAHVCMQSTCACELGA
jgi:hypothetical protein